VSLELLAAFSAASVLAVSSLTLCEAHLRSATSRDDDDRTPFREAGGDMLCIVSGRAQCACGHALNAHRRYAGDACGCNRFEYIGGLVGAATDEQA
jgi:hypothetical protein